MSWSFNASGSRQEATAQVDVQLEQQRPNFNERRLPVLEAAAALVKATIAAAPPSAKVSISVGGHFNEPDVLVGAWFSASIIP